ncbi:Lrp/AsnC family transcriptional regulator [Amycolatopsis sp. NPDC059027]|uniref:Lrp/AsnC family transcriptional regulator n=1 Tax=Amycolatopsis sp. NPDC059027 TaxID=3346709 RepID=UPI0036709943
MKNVEAVDYDTLDETDQALVAALRVDGRASWTQLAAVLGISEQTVARRYRRLRSAGLLRVVGIPIGRRLGYSEWLFRIQCTPNTAPAVALALAGRPDILWIDLLAGGTEIICFPHARSVRERNDLLLDKLPRSGRVVGVSAQSVLRHFFREPAPVPPGAASPRLDENDELLLRALARDGRATYTELAEVTGRSETTVKRRLEQLIAVGAVAFAPEIDPSLLGMETEAVLWLSVAPADLDHVGRTMSGHPEISYVAAITGPANLVAMLVCRDADAFYDYLTTTLGAMPEVRTVETSPLIRNVKRSGFVKDGVRLLDPPELPRRS